MACCGTTTERLRRPSAAAVRAGRSTNPRNSHAYEGPEPLPAAANVCRIGHNPAESIGRSRESAASWTSFRFFHLTPSGDSQILAESGTTAPNGPHPRNLGPLLENDQHRIVLIRRFRATSCASRNHEWARKTPQWSLRGVRSYERVGAIPTRVTRVVFAYSDKRWQRARRRQRLDQARTPVTACRVRSDAQKDR